MRTDGHRTSNDAPRTRATAIPQPDNCGPRHVAIIMDGNGRWATQRGRPRLFGHHAGAKRVREIVRPVPTWASNI